MQQLLALADVAVDHSLQVRTSLSQETIDDYTNAYRDREVFPAIHVFLINKVHLIADGAHRYYAAKAAGRKHILCEVHQGERSDCLRYALRANAKHGLRLTNDDKRRAVALALHTWPKLSNRELGSLCGVSHTMVENLRPVIAGKAPEPPEASAPRATPRVRTPPARPEDNGEPAPTDRMGYPLPEAVLLYWNRDAEVRELLDHVTFVGNRIKDAMNQKDAMYFEVNFNAVLADLKKVFTSINTARPYAVCPTCQGKVARTCALCCGKGLISKFRWDVTVPAEVKEMRKQVIEKGQ